MTQNIFWIISRKIIIMVSIGWLSFMFKILPLCLKKPPFWLVMPIIKINIKWESTPTTGNFFSVCKGKGTFVLHNEEELQHWKSTVERYHHTSHRLSLIFQSKVVKFSLCPLLPCFSLSLLWNFFSDRCQRTFLLIDFLHALSLNHLVPIFALYSNSKMSSLFPESKYTF